MTTRIVKSDYLARVEGAGETAVTAEAQRIRGAEGFSAVLCVVSAPLR